MPLAIHASALDAAFLVGRNISAAGLDLAGRDASSFLARTSWMTDAQIVRITEDGVCQAAVEWSSCMKKAGGVGAYEHVILCTMMLLLIFGLLVLVDSASSGWDGNAGATPPKAPAWSADVTGRAMSLAGIIAGFYGTCARAPPPATCVPCANMSLTDPACPHRTTLCCSMHRDGNAHYFLPDAASVPRQDDHWLHEHYRRM